MMICARQCYSILKVSFSNLNNHQSFMQFCHQSNFRPIAWCRTRRKGQGIRSCSSMHFSPHLPGECSPGSRLSAPICSSCRQRRSDECEKGVCNAILACFVSGWLACVPCLGYDVQFTLSILWLVANSANTSRLKSKTLSSFSATFPVADCTSPDVNTAHDRALALKKLTPCRSTHG